MTEISTKYVPTSYYARFPLKGLLAEPPGGKWVFWYRDSSIRAFKYDLLNFKSWTALWVLNKSSRLWKHWSFFLSTYWIHGRATLEPVLVQWMALCFVEHLPVHFHFHQCVLETRLWDPLPIANSTLKQSQNIHFLALTWIFLLRRPSLFWSHR